MRTSIVRTAQSFVPAVSAEENHQVAPELLVAHAASSGSVRVSASTIRAEPEAWHSMRGFSVLELLAVISVMLIMSAMALPSVLSTLHARTLQSALLASAGAIQSARFQAVSTGVPYQITFNSSASTYQIEACSNCANTIYDPESTYTYAPIGAAVPFASNDGAALAADQTIYFRPGGAVQWTWGTTNCSTPLAMTFSYQGVSQMLTVECYGNVIVPQ